MRYFKFLNLTFLVLLVIVLVFPPSSVSASETNEVQGRIVSKSKRSKRVGGRDFTLYVLRIQQAKKVTKGVPRLFTAEILVEPGSLKDEIIQDASRKGDVCLFGISRRGMRYRIHEIYVLGGRFGRTITPVSPGSDIQVSGDAVYYDKKNKVIISSQESKHGSITEGNSGIILGR